MTSTSSSRTPVCSPTPSTMSPRTPNVASPASGSASSPRRNTLTLTRSSGSSRSGRRQEDEQDAAAAQFRSDSSNGLIDRRISLPPAGSNYKGKNYIPNFRSRQRNSNNNRQTQDSAQGSQNQSLPAPAMLYQRQQLPRTLTQNTSPAIAATTVNSSIDFSALTARQAYEDEFPSPGEAANVEGASIDSDGCTLYAASGADELTYYRTKHVDNIDSLMSTTVPKVHHRSPDILLGPELEEAEAEQERKLFVGGLSYNTDDQLLYDHFSAYGTLTDCIVMKDPRTKRSRGFGFVCFQRAGMLEACMAQRPHFIDQRPVEPKRAVSRLESGKPGANRSVTKLHVKWLREVNLKAIDLKEYFSQYGDIHDVQMQQNPLTKKPPKHAFITFRDYDAVDKVISSGKKAIHENSRNSISQLSPDATQPSSPELLADIVQTPPPVSPERPPVGPELFDQTSPRDLIIDKIQPRDVLHEHIISGVRCFVTKGFTSDELREIKHTMDVKRELQQRSKAKYQQEKMAAKAGYFKKQHSTTSSTYSLGSMHDSGHGSGGNGGAVQNSASGPVAPNEAGGQQCPLQDRRRMTNGMGGGNGQSTRNQYKTRNGLGGESGQRSYLLAKPAKTGRHSRGNQMQHGWKGDADKENRPQQNHQMGGPGWTGRGKERHERGQPQNMGCYTQEAVESYMQAYHDHFQAAANQLQHEVQNGSAYNAHATHTAQPSPPTQQQPPPQLATTQMQMTQPAQYQPLDLTHLQKQGLLPTTSAPLLPLPTEHQQEHHHQQLQHQLEIEAGALHDFPYGPPYGYPVDPSGQSVEWVGSAIGQQQSPVLIGGAEQFGDGLMPTPQGYAIPAGHGQFEEAMYHQWGVLPEGVEATPGLWLPPAGHADASGMMAAAPMIGQPEMMQYLAQPSSDGTYIPDVTHITEYQQQPLLQVPTVDMAELESGVQALHVEEVT